MAFLQAAADRPHHAYVLAGPEGSGKSLAARAFAAALLCHRGGCGECRDCRLALKDQHPNEFLVEPEGRDIHVDTVREEIWHPASRTAPERGRKVFVIREADRLSPAAADTLLKVLEEPPADAVFLLMSARAHELPETVRSRAHTVTFTALSESFVVDVLTSEGVEHGRAQLSARLTGGNLGRARRLAMADDGLAFREAAVAALELAARGPVGALAAADTALAAAADYKKSMRAQLDEELAPFLDEKGRPEDMYRGSIRRLEIRFKRRERRAERDFVDWVLLGVSSLLRDRIAVSVGASHDELLNPDITPDADLSVVRAARGLAGVESARAELAEDLNLNTRLVLERAFITFADIAA